jgi:hypothetical protein
VQVPFFIPCVPVIITGEKSSFVPVNLACPAEGYTDNDVLVYMDKLANDMANELTAQSGTEYVVVQGYHKLQTEDIGEHVYFTQACRAFRNFLALQGPEEVGPHAPPVWRIYFGCGTEEQRLDVASLVSTIKDTHAGKVVKGGWLVF